MGSHSNPESASLDTLDCLTLHRPANPKELFNLCHASLHNTIECIFGVIKRRFHILLITPKYSLSVQAQIPTALCAVYNFICLHDPDEGLIPGLDLPVFQEDQAGGSFAAEPNDLEDEGGGSTRCDEITQAMWEDYQHVLTERDISDENENSDDFGIDSKDKLL
jgi:hypothetical protein